MILFKTFSPTKKQCYMDWSLLITHLNVYVRCPLFYHISCCFRGLVEPHMLRLHNIFFFHSKYHVRLDNHSAIYSSRVSKGRLATLQNLTPIIHRSHPCMSSGRRAINLSLMATEGMLRSRCCQTRQPGGKI